MITIEEARSLALKNSLLRDVVHLPLEDSNACVLAEDLPAPVDIPLFDQSAMDGYALAFDGSYSYRLVGEIKAGDAPDVVLKKGQAIRIFTGAAVPASADSIAIQEITTPHEDRIAIDPEKFQEGRHIRKKGELLRAGEIALKKGHLVNPATLGFLAGMGISSCPVYRRPKVSLLVTGSELLLAGSSPEPGKIFESNTIALKAALQKAGIHEIATYHLSDDRDKIADVLDRCLHQSDLILSTGGISVGDYDFLRDLLPEKGVESIFYKVAQKPGKPLFCGKKGRSLVFALPGNPASALVCLYVYVIPSLRKMMGYQQAGPPSRSLRLAKSLYKKGGRATFLRALIQEGEVYPLEGQDSYMMQSFSQANCLIRTPSDEKSYRPGEEVDVYIID